MGKSKNKKEKQLPKKIIALVVAVVLLLGATVAVLVPTVIIPSKKYNEAIAFLEGDKYDKAAEIFSELGSFKDSEEQLAAIPLEKYRYALRLLEAGDNGRAVLMLNEASETVIKNDEVIEIKYKFATRLTELGEYVMAAKLFDSLGDYKDSEEQLKATFKNQISSNTFNSEINLGTQVVFGTWEQDGNTENGGEPIVWLVVSQDEDGIVLVSEYALTKMRYADNLESFRWDKSAIRSWLNNDFYKSAFNSYEQSVILDSEVTGEVSENFGTSLDFTVKDKLYLLNFSEVNEYFVGDPSKIGYATAYATGGEAEACDWWLREHYGACVSNVGSTKHAEDNKFLSKEFYVRPVMKISYE